MAKSVAKSEAGRASYRMRDLVRLTGLPRETIHYYLAQRLLPAPIKTGRNTALYAEEHLQRLRRIRELQAEQFLPLKAIREVLEGEAEPSGEFTPAQRALIKRMRASASASGSWNGDGVKLSDLPATVTPREIRELAEAGMIDIRGRGRERSVSAEDAALIGAWGRLKAAGIDPEHGYSPKHAATHLEAIERIVRHEIELFSQSHAGARGEEAMRIADQALPILNEILALLHTKKFRQFVTGYPVRDVSGR